MMKTSILPKMLEQIHTLPSYNTKRKQLVQLWKRFYIPRLLLSSSNKNKYHPQNLPIIRNIHDYYYLITYLSDSSDDHDTTNKKIFSAEQMKYVWGKKATKAADTEKAADANEKLFNIMINTLDDDLRHQILKYLNTEYTALRTYIM